MAVTAFLSMWINNTATTAMMVPIVDSILSEISKLQTLSFLSDLIFFLYVFSDGKTTILKRHRIERI